MKQQRTIALLGRRDEPTDAVEEYCHYLGEALRPRGYAMEIVRVPWAEQGWRTALKNLRAQSVDWRGAWVLLQYTALAWSARGFPVGAARAFRITKESGARTGVVFHDALAYFGARAIDVIRRRCQLRVMRRIFACADRAVLTVAREKIPWLPADDGKAVFIPVGANLPPAILPKSAAEQRHETPVVAVFGVTGGGHLDREVKEIACAVNRASMRAGRIHLIVFGRNAVESREPLERELDRSRVELETRGVLPAADVARTLSQSDVLLFVRGHISSRRSSALAAIACGLPVVAYRGPETAPPVTEAGLELVERGDLDGLAAALERVLTDNALRNSLRERSRMSQEKYFSWDVIAARYAEVLPSVE